MSDRKPCACSGGTGPDATQNGAGPDGYIRNNNLLGMSDDVLYHFALSTKTHDLPAMFGDVKFVCIGGSDNRMESFAHFVKNELNLMIPTGCTLTNIAAGTDRYAMYKIGPVLSISHGMGIPSISIMLHETIKLLHHAQATDVTIFRLGTCGGLGLQPGTVVLTTEAVDGTLRPYLTLPILGKVVERPAVLDVGLATDICTLVQPEDAFSVVAGKTMCTLDFYEGQARLDGAFCDYGEKEKIQFLNDCHAAGVLNIEMESLCFAAMCHHAGLKGAVISVTLLDRLKGDAIDTPHNILNEWGMRPAIIACRYIKQQMKKNKWTFS